MKITIGEWKTRDGRKAIVAAENKEAEPQDFFVGWVDGCCMTWFEDGLYLGGGEEYDKDLIEQWTDPVPWDWSTTPPWINWIAMWSDGDWFMFNEEPVVNFVHKGWTGGSDESVSHLIPPSHAPKWSGDWRNSKTMRPGFNGGAK